MDTAALTLPETLTKIDTFSFHNCSGLTSLTLPDALTDFGSGAFKKCTALTSVVFRSRVSRAFTTFSVGSMRNRANWQITSVKNLRNVLRLITAFACERRDLVTIDPEGSKRVFEGCTGMVINKC